MNSNQDKRKRLENPILETLTKLTSQTLHHGKSTSLVSEVTCHFLMNIEIYIKLDQTQRYLGKAQVFLFYFLEAVQQLAVVNKQENPKDAMNQFKFFHPTHRSVNTSLLTIQARAQVRRGKLSCVHSREVARRHCRVRVSSVPMNAPEF